MSRAGAIQHIGSNVTIATVETLLGTAIGLMGAIAIQIRLSGGMNSTNRLKAIRVQSLDGDGDPAKSSGGQSWLSDPDLTDLTIAAIKTHQAPPDGGFVYLIPNNLNLAALPEAAIYGTMDGAQSTGVDIDAWAIYPDAGSRDAGRLEMP
jgi:hypothetical protein